MKSARFQPLFVPAVDDRGILGPLLIALGRRLRERVARQSALLELERLDERTLLDLGISPADFAAIADGSYRRPAADEADRTGARAGLPLSPYY
jgi:uncharacterized protein YjiS (DUF1127 family)